MAKLQQDNIGAQSQDGINAKVGMTFLNPNRTLLMMALQGDDSPSDPDEMVVSGEATYSIDKMFKSMKPGVEVSLSTGDAKNPLEDVEIKYTSIKSFDPEDVVDRVPLLRAMKDKQSLIGRLEQLLQEGAFRKILEDGTKKEALIGFLHSVIADIDAAESEEED